MINAETIQAARERIRGQVAETPCVRSQTLSALLGCELFIKFENQQFTASFKERGALNCLLSLDAPARESGVVAMSAGNHAQALAFHGARLDIPTTIVMPRHTPNSKVEQTRVHGAEVILHGAHFDETLEFTASLATRRGLTIVHPYDDPRVIAGQASAGLEILEQVPDLDAVVVPVGGGGLISGVALAVKEARPECEVWGVQMRRYPAVHNAFHGTETPARAPDTVAEGIAVKSPGSVTFPLIREHVDEVVTVSETDVEDAIFTLLEVEKTVSEGAGAASLAAVSTQADHFTGRKVVIVLSGGNIDMMVLSSVVLRGLVRSHRLVRLRVEIPDVPGALSEVTQILGELNSNIIEIDHQRAFGSSSVRTTVVDLALQMRGEEQVDNALAVLQQAGYRAQLSDEQPL